MDRTFLVQAQYSINIITKYPFSPMKKPQVDLLASGPIMPEATKVSCAFLVGLLLYCLAYTVEVERTELPLHLRTFGIMKGTF